jgi:hypothetical protein
LIVLDLYLVCDLYDLAQILRPKPPEESLSRDEIMIVVACLTLNFNKMKSIV